MALIGIADLHTHTTASDGTGTPAGNVRLAHAAGLAAIAITDHDTTAGIREAVEEGAKLRIAVIPGVEISTIAEGRDIHMLGYFIDWQDERLLERLRSLRDVRGTRNEMIVAKLCELGMTVTMNEVIREAGKAGKPDASVGRPHIAQVLLNKGYVSSMAEAFDKYLGSEGAAYINPPRITPYDAVTWIHEAGGAAVVAHPGLYDRDELVESIVRFGADGIEAYHSDHKPADEARYAAMAERLGVIATGGSDYHGERNGIVFHGPIGGRTAPAGTVDKLDAARCKYKA